MTTPRHPKLPQNPTFYERALDHLPVAVLVVRGDGVITYGNRALVEMSGWSVARGVGIHMLEVVHPDDHEFVINVFTNVITGPRAEQTLGAARWAPIRFRLIGYDGSVIPIEVVGGGGLTDPDLDGIVYAVRSCRDDELLTELLTGVASHRPIELGCPALVERLALPPARLDSVIFEQHANGTARWVVATHDALQSLPATCTGDVPWGGLVTEPARVDLDTLPADTRDLLVSAGFRSCFHTGAHSPDHELTLRIIACGSEDPAGSDGILSQLGQTRELLAIIAAKTYNDSVIANHATRDDLTGLPNRLALEHRFERVRASTDDCAVMFVDVDNFKQINDEFGHAAGDRVLQSVADRLVRTVRPDDFVCRIGGDEFAVVLAESEGRLGQETVRIVAEHVVAILTEPVSFDDAQISLAASVGVAKAGADRDFERLMSRADGAMYRAKRAGGGRHHLDSSAA